MSKVDEKIKKKKNPHKEPLADVNRTRNRRMLRNVKRDSVKGLSWDI